MFNLEGVIGRLAREAGAHAITKHYKSKPYILNDSNSSYVVISKDKNSVEEILSGNPGWRKAKIGSVTWTDNYTNILPVIASEKSWFSPLL